MSDSKASRTNQPYEQIGELVSIFKRGNAWYANWQDGRNQRRKSLRTSSKKEARLRALRLEADILDGRFEKPQPAAPIREVIDAYDRYLESERRKAKTITKYRAILKRVRALAESKDLERIDEITAQFLDYYRHERVKAGRSPKTIYNETVVVRQLVNFAKSRGLLASDPLHGLRISEPKPTPQPCFTKDEVEQIIAESSEPQRSTYTILADTGARIGEIKCLTWDDIDFDRNRIHIRPKDNWTPKTGDQRAIPMTKRVRTLLNDRSKIHRWVFTAAPSSKYPLGDHQISERRLLRSLKRLLKRLGVEGHLHTFRHAFISHALSTGVPESVVRNIVGHVDERIIRLYTHIADQRMQEAMRQLEGIPGGPVSTPESGVPGNESGYAI